MENISHLAVSLHDTVHYHPGKLASVDLPLMKRVFDVKNRLLDAAHPTNHLLIFDVRMHVCAVEFLR